MKHETKKTALHALATVAVIGVAASLAHAIETYADITRPGPDQSPPYSASYGYKVKGSRAKGSEKYHMSEGSCFVSDRGVSCGGLLEASRHDRPSFSFNVYGPVGDGNSSDTSLKVNYDSRRSDPEDTSLDRGELGFSLEALDRDLGGSSQEFKRAPVAVDGEFDVERMKVRGKVRLRRGRLSGSLKFLATGTVAGGDNDGKPFKAQLRTRIRNAPEDQPR